MSKQSHLDEMLASLATKSDLAELRADMRKGFSRQTKLIIGVWVAGCAVFSMAMPLVLRNANSESPAPSQQPIIIINLLQPPG